MSWDSIKAIKAAPAYAEAAFIAPIYFTLYLKVLVIDTPVEPVNL